MKNEAKTNGPYFVDQDGDTGIIGPGIHAGAPEGCALFDALETAIYGAGADYQDQELTDRLQEALQDYLPALMNLAYSEGKKAR
jgi:hypothetical protein